MTTSSMYSSPSMTDRTTSFSPISKRMDLNIDDEMRASSVFVALFLLLDSDRLATVPKSVADAVARKIGLAEIKQPFEPLIVPNYFGWHRSQDRDECHEWVRQQFLDLFTKTNGRAKT